MRTTYPDAHNLSRCAQPIQMRTTYPDANNLSGCAQPIRMRTTYPDTRVYASPYARACAWGGTPSHTLPLKSRT